MLFQLSLKGRRKAPACFLRYHTHLLLAKETFANHSVSYVRGEPEEISHCYSPFLRRAAFLDAKSAQVFAWGKSK
jgi:hypothetical protein